MESTKTQLVKIDKTAPTASASLSGTTVTLSGDDATSGLARLEYRVGSAGAFQTYAGPFSLGSGRTAVYHAVDVAGNVSSDQSIGGAADTAKPIISATTPSAGATYSVHDNSGGWALNCSGTGNVCATVTDNDSVATVTYSLVGNAGSQAGKCWDGSAFVSGASCSATMVSNGGSAWAGATAISRSTLGVGTFTVTFRATDPTGNVQTLVVSFSTDNSH